jgi:hypothetical protein
MTIIVHVAYIQIVQLEQVLFEQTLLKSFESKVSKLGAHQVNHFLLRLLNVCMILHVLILFKNILILQILLYLSLQR